MPLFIIINLLYFLQERENQEAKQRREHFLQSSRVVAAANASVGHKSESQQPESSESSDSGSSFGKETGGSRARGGQQGGRGYIRVPTSDNGDTRGVTGGDVR